MNFFYFSNLLIQNISYRIRQLELSVDQLQQKVMLGVKQEQLRLVKQGTVPGADNQDSGGTTAQQQHQEDSASPQQLHRMDIVNRNQDVVDDEDKPQQLQHMDEGGVIGDSNNNSEGGQQHHQQSYWPSSGGQQQQRIRILGISGSTTTSSGGDRGIPQLHPNAPYFDDEMDDDEEVWKRGKMGFNLRLFGVAICVWTRDVLG